MTDIKHRIQIHAPFAQLRDGLLDHFIRHGLNPEIYFDARALDESSPADFESVATAFGRNGSRVTFHAPFQDLAPGSTDSAVRAATARRFDQLLGLVPLFKPRTMVAHAGYDPKRHDYIRPRWIENSLAFWPRVADVLNRAGARLVLENVYEHRPEDMGELLEKLKHSNVGLCLDCGHLMAFGRANLGDWLASLGNLIAQLHLHDNQGEKDEHLPMGSGRIDFAQLFAYLKSTRPEPPIATLEMHRIEDLEPSLDYLGRTWPW
jgi:sugar phosphate isomerase/epimerase